MNNWALRINVHSGDGGVGALMQVLVLGAGAGVQLCRCAGVQCAGMQCAGVQCAGVQVCWCAAILVC